MENYREKWKAINGEIPEGYVIHHRDRNRDNNTPDNLLCMSRAEHSRLHGKMARKSPSYPLTGTFTIQKPIHFYPVDLDRLDKLVKHRCEQAKKDGTKLPRRSEVIRQLIADACEVAGIN